MYKTKKLYYEDVYKKEFTATVLECRQGKKGYEIILDETAFYPEGGGQPSDTGILKTDDGKEIQVKDVQEKDGELLHYTDIPVEICCTVRGRIDWDRRFDLMQQHSGEHIVSGLVHEAFGYDNVGFHMGSDVITIDFSGVLDERQMAEIDFKGPGTQKVPGAVYLPSQGIFLLPLHEFGQSKGGCRRGEEKQDPVHAIVPEILSADQEEVGHNRHGNQRHNGPNPDLTAGGLFPLIDPRAKIHPQEIGREPGHSHKQIGAPACHNHNEQRREYPYALLSHPLNAVEEQRRQQIEHQNRRNIPVKLLLLLEPPAKPRKVAQRLPYGHIPHQHTGGTPGDHHRQERRQEP